MIRYRFVRAARPYYNSQSYSLEVSSYGAYLICALKPKIVSSLI